MTDFTADKTKQTKNTSILKQKNEIGGFKNVIFSNPLLLILKELIDSAHENLVNYCEGHGCG